MCNTCHSYPQRYIACSEEERGECGYIPGKVRKSFFWFKLQNVLKPCPDVFVSDNAWSQVSFSTFAPEADAASLSWRFLFHAAGLPSPAFSPGLGTAVWHSAMCPELVGFIPPQTLTGRREGPRIHRMNMGQFYLWEGGKEPNDLK